MKVNSIVFPGQGAQKLGMAADFVETYHASADVFEQAQRVLPFDIFDVCFVNDSLIDLTEFTQPAIVTAEIAMLSGLKEAFGLTASYFGGHSLGEYAALVAANVLPLDVALTLVHKRGQLMQSVNVDGGMTAIIMNAIPIDSIRQVASNRDIDVANDNSIQQVVLSGNKRALDAVVAELERQYLGDEHGFRAVPLKVSAPFHSRYMQQIEEEFHAFLKEHRDSFALNGLPAVVSNVRGGFYDKDRAQLVTALAGQLSGSVRWRDNMAALITKGEHIIELGPNRPLRGFFKTLGVDIQSIINVRSAQKVLTS